MADPNRTQISSESRRVFAIDAGRTTHWGKLFTLSADEIARSYERVDDFCLLRRRFDPAGKFDDAYLERMLGPR